MISRGEKPLALIRCSFEQSQEIINKHENTRKIRRYFLSGLSNHQLPLNNKILTCKQTWDYVRILHFAKVSKSYSLFSCANEVNTDFVKK